MEQARDSVLCSGVDHHPGGSGGPAVTLPAHISTVQGREMNNEPSLCWRVRNLQSLSPQAEQSITFGLHTVNVVVQSFV